MGAAVERSDGAGARRNGAKLEGLAVWLAGVRGAAARRLATRVLLVLAGDPGADPTSTSAAVGALLAGNDVAGLASDARAELRVLDLGVADDDAPDAVRRYKVRRGSGSIATEPALADDETLAALRAGVAIADAEIDAGADLLLLASIGGGAVQAAAVVSAVTGGEPVDVVGRGGGDSAWGRSVTTVRDALRRSSASPLEPLRLLSELAGVELVAACGVLVAAAARRTPVVLDGLVPAAAALPAALLAPGAEAYWLAAQRSPDPAHALALAHLGIEPLLDLGIARGDGVGALLALPLLDAALALAP